MEQETNAGARVAFLTDFKRVQKGLTILECDPTIVLEQIHNERSESDLSSSPVSSFGVVPDFVVSSISDPVWQSSVAFNLVSNGGFSSETLD